MSSSTTTILLSLPLAHPSIYSQIERMFRRLLPHPPPPSIDVESLAQDYWLDCVEKNYRPSLRLVTQRVIQAVRHLQVELHARQALAHFRRWSELSGTDLGDLNLDLDQLMSITPLTSFQSLILYKHFYLGQSAQEISSDLSLPRTAVSSTLNSAINALKRSARSLV